LRPLRPLYPRATEAACTMRPDLKRREKAASMTKSPLAPFVAGQTLSSYQIRDDQDELADIERLRQVSLVASD
jgi:hypothetical protein